jgi:hypothetical protein
MRPEELPEILPEASPDPKLMERIATSVTRDLKPVRPLNSAGTTVSSLMVVVLAIAALGATTLGFFGLIRLSPGAIAVIFPALAGLVLLSAAASVNAMTPGSKRPFHPAALMAAGCGIMAAIFAVVFRDHSLGRFVPQGVACLKAGLLWAVPSAVLIWILLRRGYAVDRAAAGIACGTLAGLTGLAVLEFHCPNFRLWHLVVWHLAVVPVAAAVVAIVYFFSGSKRRAAELMQ